MARVLLPSWEEWGLSYDEASTLLGQPGKVDLLQLEEG